LRPCYGRSGCDHATDTNNQVSAQQSCDDSLVTFLVTKSRWRHNWFFNRSISS